MGQKRRRAARTTTMFVSSNPIFSVRSQSDDVRVCRFISPICTAQTFPISSSLSSSTTERKRIIPISNAETIQAPSATARNAQAETLEILEWTTLSQYVSRLARTDVGRALLEDGIHGNGLEIGEHRARCEELLEETREMYRLIHILGRDVPLIGASEVSGTAKDAEKGRVLSGRELRAVAATLVAARKTRRALEAAHSDTNDGFPRLIAHARAARTWPDIEKAIVDKIDEFGDVTDVADDQLLSVRIERRELVADLRAKLRDLMAANPDAVQERTISMRYDRFVIPVKVTRKAVFRGGIVHDVSATGGTAYIEPLSVRRMNDRMRALEAKEKARVRAVVRELSESIAPIADDVVTLCAGLAALDAAGARTEASVLLDCVDVTFADDDDDSGLRLRGVRHPLLSWAAKTRATVSEEENDWKLDVIPSDFLVPAGVRCVCITGSNTGGKTVALKTFSMIVLMAKAGLFIPAQKLGIEQQVIVPYFDKVLIDAGDDQSLVQSLSTFSGHVERIKRILDESTSQSLVLLDEIGSGTDPQEGAAIGAATLRSLAVGRRAKLTMATTHHGELKTLKYASDGTGSLFENASVEFDDIEMKPTYRLLWGIPGRSNALSIAERLGLPSDIIEDARELLMGNDGGNRVNFEQMIKNLEEQRRIAEEATQSALQAHAEASTLREEAETKLQKLSDAEGKLRLNQQVAVEAEIASAKKSIAGVIKDLQRGGQSAQKAAAATGKLDRIEKGMRKDHAFAETNIPVEKEDSAVRKEIKVGDLVQVKELGSGYMEVVDISGGGELTVAMGRMKTRVKRKDVVEVQVRKREVSPKRPRTLGVSGKQKKKNLSVRTAANTVDLRGERVEASESLVEQAMARALPIGVLWIVHGHGTGRLRNGIREFLRGHELVESYRNAEDCDGGTGVTVVELK